MTIQKADEFEDLTEEELEEIYAQVDEAIAAGFTEDDLKAEIEALNATAPAKKSLSVGEQLERALSRTTWGK